MESEVQSWRIVESLAVELLARPLSLREILITDPILGLVSSRGLFLWKVASKVKNTIVCELLKLTMA